MPSRNIFLAVGIRLLKNNKTKKILFVEEQIITRYKITNLVCNFCYLFVSRIGLPLAINFVRSVCLPNCKALPLIYSENPLSLSSHSVSSGARCRLNVELGAVLL